MSKSILIIANQESSDIIGVMKEELRELANHWLRPNKMHERDLTELTAAVDSMREEGILEVTPFDLSMRAIELHHQTNFTYLIGPNALYKTLSELKSNGVIDLTKKESNFYVQIKEGVSGT